MKHFFLLIFSAILLLGCSNGEDSLEEEISKDVYFVKYATKNCTYHDHFVKIRDAEGNLISYQVSSFEEVSWEIGPVSPNFQAYMEGSRCPNITSEFIIYVKKNNQDYIQFSKASIRSTDSNSHQNATLTFNLREYD